MRKQIKYLIGIFIILLAIILFPKPKSFSYYEAKSNLKEVEIVGAINNPGKYNVPSGVNLAFLVNLAGGLTNNADVTNINLSTILSDKYYEIPTYYLLDEKIITVKENLNKITFQELLLIPNITETRALNILIFREENGGFNSINDLLEVKGIGPATFEKIKIYFTVWKSCNLCIFNCLIYLKLF